MTSLATDKSAFDVAKRTSHLRRLIADAEKELESLPSLANPVSKGTIGASDIIPGTKVILLGFGTDVFVQPVEFAGYIRRFHDELLQVSVAEGSINLVSYGILPDISGAHVEGVAAFPDTSQGRSDAKNFLYRIWTLEDARAGELIYPNAGKAIELLESYDKRKFVAQNIDYDYLAEDPRTRDDLLL